jgi:hypothetical protein
MCSKKLPKSFPQVGHSPSAQMFTGEAKKRQGLHLPIDVKAVIYLQEVVIILPFGQITVDMAGLSDIDPGMSRLQKEGLIVRSFLPELRGAAYRRMGRKGSQKT